MGKFTEHEYGRDETEDKEWARKYILDPLTAPEPHQLDGPGSSFYSHKHNHRRAASVDCKGHYYPPTTPATVSPSLAQIHQPEPDPADDVHQQRRTRTRSLSVTSIRSVLQRRSSSRRPSEPTTTSTTTRASEPKGSSSQRTEPVRPTNPSNPGKTSPPTSAGPTTSASASASASTSTNTSTSTSTRPRTPIIQRARVNSETPTASDSKSPNKKAARPASTPAPAPAPITPSSPPSLPASLPHTPRPRPSRKEKTPPLSSQNKSRLRQGILPQARSFIATPVETHPSAVTTSTPPSLRRTGSFMLNASGEMSFQPPFESTKMSSPQVGRAPSVASRHSASPISPNHMRPPSYASSRTPSRSPSSANASRSPAANAPPPGSSSGAKPGHHSSPSSSSHRKHRAPKPGRPLADVIDRLDQTGPSYHHGGPYDATLAAVNVNKKKSPLEAVKDSNLEALKATPQEYIHDSLTKHVPLQGTAIVPPGMTDWNGHVMDYQEGADLMREPDAAGGAYKRYDFIDYHPDDLKGKGGSYLAEKAEKENAAKLRKMGYKPDRRGGGGSYELHDQRPNRAGNNDSSVPLLAPQDGAEGPIRMHRHSSARTSSHRSHLGVVNRNRSQSLNHDGANAVPRGAAASGNDASSLARSSSVSHDASSARRRDIDSLSSYRSELRGDDTGHVRTRSNSAGQRIADGIRRHLGSLRRS